MPDEHEHELDFDALLSTAGLPEATETVCMHPQLVADHQALETRLQEAQQRRVITQADGAEARRIAEEMVGLRERMAGSLVPIRLRAMPRHRRDEFCAAHPAPADSEDAFDLDAAGLAFLRACVVSPEMTDEQWARFVDVVAPGALDRLIGKAIELCWGPTTVPFSLTAYAEMLRSGESSKRPGPSVSPAAGSSGGNRAQRRATSTTRKAASSRR